MSSYHLQRVNDEIKRVIAEIFIRDHSYLSATSLITVTKVTCTTDLREARVYLSIYNNDTDQIAATFKQIRGEAGYIRGLLGQRMIIRHVPKINFYFDDTQQYAEKMERIFHQIHQEHEPDDAEGDR